jgi:peptidyl-prolyl cis-trans isomerase SurA
MRIFRKLILAGLLASFGTVQLKAELLNGIEAIVSDAIITSQQLEFFIGQSAQAVHDLYANRPELYRKNMVDLHTNGLDILIQRELILHDFATLPNKVPESLVDRIVEEEVHRRQPDRVQFIKKLQEEGMTFEQYKKGVRDGLIIDELTREFVKEPIISPHRIELYYNQNHDKYKIEDQVKTRMIVVNQSAADDPGTASKRAREILMKIKGGAAFEEMAKVYSDSPPRSRGARSDWMELSKLAEAIRDPITKLKPGECSDVIESKDACFIVMLDERRPEHFTPLNEVRVQIERQLIAQEETRLKRRWIDRLKNKTWVRYF